MAVIKRGKAWVAVVGYQDPQTGKRRQVWRSFPKKKAAENEEAKLRADIARGVGILAGRIEGEPDLTPEKVTVSAYFDHWLKSVRGSKNLKASTEIRYRELLANLRPLVGHKRLARLMPIDIHAAYGALADQGLSAKTRLNVHRVLKMSLDQAVRMGFLHRNVADAVDAPRALPYQAAAVGLDELKAIFAVTDATSYAALVRFSAYTGLRQGEALALTWADVDIEGAVLHVRRTVRRERKQGMVFGAPKTHRSSRPVQLSEATIELLRRHRAAQKEARLKAGAAWKDNDLVFPSWNGQPMDGSYLGRLWRGWMGKAGLAGVRWHDLRHGHASLMLKAGVNPKVVAERLGHSRISVTMDVYSAVLPGVMTDATERFDRLISGLR
jgi:integrase